MNLYRLYFLNAKYWLARDADNWKRHQAIQFDNFASVERHLQMNAATIDYTQRKDGVGFFYRQITSAKVLV